MDKNNTNGLTMNTEDRVLKTFSSVFNSEEGEIKLSDTKNDIESWDSIGHLQLIMHLESEFDIKLNTEDVVKIDSVEKCINTVNNRLNK